VDVFFSSEGRFLNLLPINLRKVDLAEEQFWATDSREGIEANPLFALLVKKDSALYFHEKILPEMALMGENSRNRKRLLLVEFAN
jgi:hypothetical protein